MGKAKWWVCPGCQSLNDVPANKCYKCRVKKPAAPVLLDDQYGHLQSERRVGITVELRKVAEIAARDPIERQRGTGVVEAFDEAEDDPAPAPVTTSSRTPPPPPLRPIRDPVKRGIAQAGGKDWRDGFGPLPELPVGEEPQESVVAAEDDDPVTGSPLQGGTQAAELTPGPAPAGAPPAGMAPGAPLPQAVAAPGPPLHPGMLPPGPPRQPWDPAGRPGIITLPAGVPPPPGWLPLGPVMPTAVPGMPSDLPGASPPDPPPPAAPGPNVDRRALRFEADPPWPAEPGVPPRRGLTTEPEDRST
jgi:hypothetical protein